MGRGVSKSVVLLMGNRGFESRFLVSVANLTPVAQPGHRSPCRGRNGRRGGPDRLYHASAGAVELRRREVFEMKHVHVVTWIEAGTRELAASWPISRE
jgi:hypothetical protein